MDEYEIAERAQAEAGAAAVVSGPATLLVRERLILRAYMTRACSPTGMQLTRGFTATIRKFNQTYGARCRTWAQVAQCAYWMLEGK